MNLERLFCLMRIKQIINKYRYYNKVKKTCKKCGENLHVNGYTVVNSNTVLGDNVNFNGLTMVGNGNVYIGSNFHSGQNCYIITENHDYDDGDCIPYDAKRSIQKDTIIEDNVWLGIGVIVLAGAYIGEGAIVQAGSVVCGKVDKFSIVGGHPARKFGERNIQHYEALKEQGKFA